MSSDTIDIPDFSILIPTYNRSKFLKLALSSVLRQKGVSLEVIVSDNCSTDNTEEMVKEFRDKRIKYSKNKKNLGYGPNAHKCFHKASGNYIFTLSDDDFILYDNTLLEILKVMRKYKMAIGKIGTISYEKSPNFPYRTYILSKKLIVLKPGKDKNIILKTLDFELGFFSGLIFDNFIIDKKKWITHIGYTYFPLAYDAILKKGIAFIPNHYIVANLSLRFWKMYFNIEKFGSFYVEDLLPIVKEFAGKIEYEEYKKRYISGGIVMLPSHKYFTNNRNYLRILQRYVTIDKTLILSPRFIIYAIGGFLPKFIIKVIRDLIVAGSRKRVIEEVGRYNYFQEIKGLGV